MCMPGGGVAGACGDPLPDTACSGADACDEPASGASPLRSAMALAYIIDARLDFAASGVGKIVNGGSVGLLVVVGAARPLGCDSGGPCLRSFEGLWTRYVAGARCEGAGALLALILCWGTVFPRCGPSPLAARNDRNVSG